MIGTSGVATAPQAVRIAVQNESKNRRRRPAIALRSQVDDGVSYTKVVAVCTSCAGGHPHWQWPREAPASSLLPMETEHIRDHDLAHSQLRILVVDDNEDAAVTMSLLLEMKGYLTGTVHNGREAVTAAMQDRFDAVLLDLNMPVMDGFEAAGELGRLRPPPRLIACSARDDIDTRKRTSELGFCAHLTKPVPLELLEVTLQRHCRAERSPSPIE